MQKDFYLHQKGFSLIVVFIIATCLLILGLSLVGLFSYEMQFLYRSSETKVAHPLAESGMSSGLWRTLWGPDVKNTDGGDIKNPQPNGIPDILEEIVGINYYEKHPTDITRNGYIYTTTFAGRKVTVKIEKESQELVSSKEKIINIPLPGNGGTIWDTAVITDIDPGDNKKDIFVATNEGYIYRISTWVENGEFKYEFVHNASNDSYIKILESQIILGAPQIVDIDNDGTLEIVFGSSGSSSGTKTIYVYNAEDGTSQKGFGSEGKVLLDNSLKDDSDNDGDLDSFPTGGRVVWRTQVADLDGDRRMEIVASAEKAVVCVDSEGNLKWMFSGDKPPGQNSFIWAPQIGDVTGDGKLDVVIRDAGNKYDYNYDQIFQAKYGANAPWWAKPGRIYVLDGNTGSQTSKYELGPTYQCGWWNSPPGMGDLNNDGTYEILFGGGSDPNDITNCSGWWFYVINPDGAANGEQEVIRINVKNDWYGNPQVDWNGMNIPHPDNVWSTHGLPLAHEYPIVVDSNNDGINDAILWGTDDLGPAVSMFSVNLVTGNYTYDINNDGTWELPTWIPDERPEDYDPNRSWINGWGDVQGTPAWLNIDDDSENEIVYTTTAGRIMVADYDHNTKRYEIRNEYTFPHEPNQKISGVCNAGPSIGDIDGDRVDDAIAVTCITGNPPGQGGWSGQVAIWRSVGKGGAGGEIVYLKITSTAPMLKKELKESEWIYESNKKVIAHIAVKIKSNRATLLSKEAIEDVGL